MTDRSEEEPLQPYAGEAGSGEPGRLALEAGLAALKNQDVEGAIALLESVLHSNAQPATDLRARAGLIRAYELAGHVEAAIALCQFLQGSSSAQARQWASKTLRSLTQKYPQATTQPTPAPSPSSPPETTSSRPIIQPFPLSPNADLEAGLTRGPKRGTSPPRSQIAQPHMNQPPANPPSPSQPEPNSAVSSASASSSASSLDSWPDSVSAFTEPARRAPATQPSQRAQRWSALAPVSPWKLRGWMALTIAAMIFMLTVVTRGLMMLFNATLGHINIPFVFDFRTLALYSSPIQAVFLFILIMLCISPLVLTLLLRSFHGMKSLSLQDLRQVSPEAARLVEQTFVKTRNQLHRSSFTALPVVGSIVSHAHVPELAILPTSAPLIFCYGLRPSPLACLVISQGLLDHLEDEEIAALVAAEIAHIQHYDFVVMSMVLAIAYLPFLAYCGLARWSDRFSNRVVQTLLNAVAAGFYGIYWLIRLCGLGLSRFRSYDGDRTATALTGNPNELTRALLKLTVRLAHECQTQRHTPPLLEVVEFMLPVSVQQSLTLGSMYAYTPEIRLLDWDRLHPYRHWLSIRNTHPPLGDRLQQLTQIARYWRLTPELDLAAPPKQKVPPKMDRLFLQQSGPFLGAGIGLVIGMMVFLFGAVALRTGAIEFAWLNRPGILVGCSLLGFSVGMLLRINAFFPDIKSTNIQSNPAIAPFLSDPEAMPIPSTPVRLQGTLLGRTNAQNVAHQDLFLQLAQGELIKLHYVSVLGPCDGCLPQPRHPRNFINRSVVITGWLRRGATLWIDIDTLQTPTGKTLKAGHPIWSTVMAIASTLIACYLFVTIR
ncbi:M48 family metalloprotease [Leptolyngbya sp. AN02str]|uniref:M48 family metalloprotease n=1 Tax=Leptolyngbya sp. AN02str TaxID=3423363 RepID=UPI003D31D8E2